MNCSICQGEIEKQMWQDEIIWDRGHNAQPINDGRCCDNCNFTIVLKARLTQIANK